ncbi:hypothetical protein B0H14DRAFT_2587117 [Mycena olivaceomarginata]|nr:hypothetical protein B0H14DRAFT_2587117 [Mycena olivaceomarginata]
MQGQRRPRRLLALQGVFPLKCGKARSAAILTLDAVRMTLEVAESSVDAYPPLKSAVGGVAARVAASAADAEALAWRAVAILDEMYNSVDTRSPDTIPPHLLHSIARFEQSLPQLALS